jgi:murein DD-endopeptidase MepM/ murein hydrolase activator NlpD
MNQSIENRFASLFANISMILALLVLGVVSFSKYATNARAGARKALPTPTLLPETLQDQTILPKLPEFQLPKNSYSEGILRRTDLFTTIPNRPRVDVVIYEVQTGDNLFLIAERYGLKPETVLWGNYDVLRDNPQTLSPGQELNILPVDGVYYQWDDGDSLQNVADFFEVELDSIIGFSGNRLPLYDFDPQNPPIEPGSWLIVPGGRRALKDWGPPAITRNNPASAAYYGSGYCGNIYEGAIGTGAFIWPTPATYLSGYDYNPSIHPALDIAGAEGNAIFAADSGVVVYAGWSEYGYGYLTVIDHGNGWQSAYAHQSAVAVTCGQSVARGTRIGAVGNTGNSSGAHLHFELRSEIYGKVNPWNFMSP